MNKFVIYTAIIGNYDEILQPQVIDDRFDYVLFSNENRENRVGVWQVRPIAYVNDIQTKIARYVKTHPEELLPEYDASLWMDANIVICDKSVYDCFIKKYDSNVLVATMKHTLWNCVYDEMFSVLCCRFEHEKTALKWGQKLRKDGYPKNNGLCETGVFYRRHSDVKVQDFDKIWWASINDYSRRDQFSVNYALWSCGLEFEFFISEKENVYNSSVFSHVEHEGHIPQLIKWRGTEAWLIRYCMKKPEKKTKIRELYYKIYGCKFPEIMAFVLGQFYRIVYLLKIKK